MVEWGKGWTAVLAWAPVVIMSVRTVDIKENDRASI
jgi:hypothetical protein